MKGIFSKSFGIAAIAVIFVLCIPNKCWAADASSPWGIVPVWWVGSTDDTLWRNLYCWKLDSTSSCGISWIRPNSIPRIDKGLNIWDYTQNDSCIAFANEKDLNFLFINFPDTLWYDDTLHWKEYWTKVVDRYDKDGTNDMPNLTKPIRYWNICNEPYHWRNDCYNGTLDHFRLYLRISSDAIHDADPDSAKVVAPTIAPLNDRWDTLEVGDTVYSMYNTPDYFWGQILDNGGANYIDAISVNRHWVKPPKIFSDLDSCATLLNNHGAGNKPVWMTETGWTSDSSGGVQYQAEWYREFCEEMLEDTVLDKVFFFTLADGAGWGNYGILYTNKSHKPAYDTLKEWILPPAAPTGLRDTVLPYPGNPNYVVIRLDWDANSESDLKGYKVYHKLASQSQFTLLDSTSNTHYYHKVFKNTKHDYYVTAYDKVENESEPSDTIRVHAVLQESSPFVFAWDGTEFVINNSILPASEFIAGDNTDYYKIETHLEEQDNRYLLQIIELANHHTYLDQMKLFAVDHPEDEELSIGTTFDGDIIAYEEPISLNSCTDNHGNDQLDAVATVGNGYYSGEDGNWLDLDFGEVAEEGQVIIVGTWMAAKSALHVQVQENGEWEDVGFVYPRAMYSTTLVSLSEFSFDGKVRIYCEGNAIIDYVALAEPDMEDVTIRECPLKSAIHSEEGSVKQELLNVDENYAEIMPGDTINLAFTAIGKKQDYVRDFVLVSTGYYTDIEGMGGTMSAGSEVLPSNFELCGGHPNPFTSETQIKFTILEEAQVSLGIYDVTGKVVTTLISERIEVGQHAITWEPEDLPSGIYFVRFNTHTGLETESYTEIKKLILVR